MTRVVITVLGKDRPGIIAAVSKLVYEMDGNIEDSSMTILEGEFAMILIVAFKKDISIEALRSAFDDFEGTTGLKVFIKSLPEEEMKREEPVGVKPFTISVFGLDKPGIIYGVTSLLAERYINITDMKTRFIEGDNKPLYALVIEADIPEEIDVETLKRELSELGGELNVDISINPIDPLKL